MGIAAGGCPERPPDSRPGWAANPARVRLVVVDQGIFVAGAVGPVVPAPVPLVLELPDVAPLLLLPESVLLPELPAPMPLPVVLDPDMPLEPMLDDDVSLGDVLEPVLDEPMLPVLVEPMLPALDVAESVLPVDDVLGVIVVVESDERP